MNRIADTTRATIAVSLTLTLSASALASCSTNRTNDGSISVSNCGETITFDQAPTRVTALRSAALPTLSRLGVLDRVTHRAGTYPTEYFDDATAAAVASIPSLTEKMDSTGHLQISREAVVATAPDLILGRTSTINPDTLASSPIPLIEEPAFCDSIKGSTSWDDVWDHVRLYGTIFHQEATAEAYIAELQQRLATIHDTTTPRKPDGSPYRIAVLYPTIGGGVTYAYGTTSMAAPVVATAGAENVYRGMTDRVFEVTAEDIIARNPDVILALHTDGADTPVINAVNAIPGIDRTNAGRDQRIFPMLLNFAEPPTPLALDGVSRLNAYLLGLKSRQPSTQPHAGPASSTGAFQ